jgi:hypothetical protein
MGVESVIDCFIAANKYQAMPQARIVEGEILGVPGRPEQASNPGI